MKNNVSGVKSRLLSYLLTILGVLLIVLSAYFFFQAKRFQAQYDQEVKVTPPPTLAPPTLKARPTQALLRVGSVSPEVKALQSRLKELGFYQGDVDGQYGGGTKEAVKLFQKQHGLKADGLAGEATLQKLNAGDVHPLEVTPEPVLPSISKKDAPLLVNRTHALPDGYTPNDLVSLDSVIPGDLAIIKEEGEKGCRVAAEALKAMFEAAHKDGLTVWQVSEGYRTADEQKALFDKKKQEYTSGTATGEKLSEQAAESETERTVARPGTSEHQTGLAFDVTVPGHAFGDTQQSRWLSEHCWQYGFILRYPEGAERITGFRYEPWHVRYVGKPHSEYIHAADITLEEYIEKLPD